MEIQINQQNKHVIIRKGQAENEMTVQDFYNFCIKNEIQDYSIKAFEPDQSLSYYLDNGYFLGIKKQKR
jgi:hypothetical protein